MNGVNDFDYQLKHIFQQIPRICSLQDNNSASSSYGCFHYAYWRDKTSEFADIRFQEAGATLALLTHPSFSGLGFDVESEDLKQRFNASVRFWHKNQNKDGSFDEWYKHEHGFAATAFSLIAKGLAVDWLGNEVFVSADYQKQFEETAHRAAKWLLKHEDLVKTNHEMAGAAALAIAGKILNSKEYLDGARDKLLKGLACQTEEGWFNEVAGMDLGYCFVLLDYTMLYTFYTNDEQAVSAMSKLFDFVFPYIQPDLTISPEAGLCLNPYVSRLGTLLLSKYNEKAKRLVGSFMVRSPGFRGLEPFLADDLRLCRWSYLPVVTQLFLKNAGIALPDVRQNAQKLNVLQIPEKTYFSKSANIISRVMSDQYAVFLPAGGGVVRGFFGKDSPDMSFEDKGYVFKQGGQTWCTVGYDRERKVEVVSDEHYRLTIPFAPAKFFFPGFISRLGLRLLGAIPGLSVWLRKFIDFYRKKNKTAINQSAAPVSSTDAKLNLVRDVSFNEGSVVVEDTVTQVGSTSLSLDYLEPLVTLNSRPLAPKEVWKSDSVGGDGAIKIRKTFEHRNEKLNLVVDLDSVT